MVALNVDPSIGLRSDLFVRCASCVFLPGPPTLHTPPCVPRESLLVSPCQGNVKASANAMARSLRVKPGGGASFPISQDLTETLPVPRPTQRHTRVSYWICGLDLAKRAKWIPQGCMSWHTLSNYWGAGSLASKIPSTTGASEGLSVKKRESSPAGNIFNSIMHLNIQGFVRVAVALRVGDRNSRQAKSTPQVFDTWSLDWDVRSFYMYRASLNKKNSPNIEA